MNGNQRISLLLCYFFTFLGLLVFFLWLGIHPRQPSFVIVDFSISQSELNTGNGTILFSLELQNPNEDSGIFYDDILLSFRNEQGVVGEKNIPSFHQGRKKRHVLSAQIDVNAQQWRTLKNAISKATIQLKVDLVTKIRYRLWGRMGRHHDMRMQNNIPIGLNGKISGNKKKIKLRRASKRLRSKYKY